MVLVLYYYEDLTLKEIGQVLCNGITGITAAYESQFTPSGKVDQYPQRHYLTREPAVW